MHETECHVESPALTSGERLYDPAGEVGESGSSRRSSARLIASAFGNP